MDRDMVLTLVGDPSAEVAVYLMAGEGRTRAVYECLREKKVALVSVGGDWDWNRDMSPWKAPRCVRGGEDFSGGAGEYLARLIAEMPAFEAENALRPKWRALSGYSLAGLFALYALYKTDLFGGASAVSGSLWFSGWIEFMRAEKPLAERPRVYLSVGDREKRTRNPWFSTIEDRMAEGADILRARGARVRFQIEEGNHFAESDPRVARGIDWLLSEEE